MSQADHQKRADEAARELALALIHLNEPAQGEYAVEIRVVLGDDGFLTYTWDWWWRRLGAGRNETAIDTTEQADPG